GAILAVPTATTGTAREAAVNLTGFECTLIGKRKNVDVIKKTRLVSTISALFLFFVMYIFTFLDFFFEFLINLSYLLKSRTVKKYDK
ncbi:unnamed protein product, partial [marine sediment metagenome]